MLLLPRCIFQSCVPPRVLHIHPPVAAYPCWYLFSGLLLLGVSVYIRCICVLCVKICYTPISCSFPSLCSYHTLSSCTTSQFLPYTSQFLSLLHPNPCFCHIPNLCLCHIPPFVSATLHPLSLLHSILCLPHLSLCLSLCICHTPAPHYHTRATRNKCSTG